MMFLCWACSPIVLDAYPPATIIEGDMIETSPLQIVGSVFYPDLRDLGHFSWHADPFGEQGVRCSFVDGCVENPLGAWGIEVLARSGSEEISSYVQQDGSFRIDVEEQGEWDIRFLLRYCTEETCFHFVEENVVYGLSHPESPFWVSSSLGVSLSPVLFQEERIESGEPNNHAHAANHFASLMEIGFIWHVQGGASFYNDKYKPLKIILPTSLDTYGRTTGPSTVHLPEQTQGWIKGNKIMHEYGHVLNLRAWDGYFWFDGEAFPNWSSVTPQESHIAFKEGFANFVARSSETEHSCSGGFDHNPPLGTLEDGLLYPRNVTRFFCDLFDDSQEEDFFFPPSFFMTLLEDVLFHAKEENNRVLSLCSVVDVLCTHWDVSDTEKLKTLALRNNINCW